MLSLHKMSILTIVAISVMIFGTTCDARMLPTRSNDDKLDKLRDLLRDVSEKV